MGAGLVASLARPGGNVTGVSSNLPALVPKQLQLLREAIPGLQRVAFLGSTDDIATRLFVEQAESATRVLGIHLQRVLVGQASEFESAAHTMVRERAQAVVVQPLFAPQSGPLAEVLGRRKLPVEEPTTFELALNLKTARAFGLTIAQSLRLRADEVVQ